MRFQDNFRTPNIRGTNLCLGNTSFTLVSTCHCRPYSLNILSRYLLSRSAMFPCFRFPCKVRRVDSHSVLWGSALVYFQYRPIWAHVFDIAKGRPLQRLHHVRRDSEYPANLFYVKFTGREELRIFWRKAYRFKRGPLLEYSDLMSI